MLTFLSPLLSFLLLYKYTALFLIAFVSSLAIPIPASIILAAAGAFSSQGYFNLLAVITFSLIGNVAGDAAGYFIARWYGEELLSKIIFFRRILRSKGYHKIKDYIFYFPQSLVYFSKFLTDLGAAVNILCGLSKVSVKKFFFFDVLGELSYILLYGLLGYALGAEWENNIGFFTKMALVILPLGLILSLSQALFFRRKSRKLQNIKS